jgi:hypothetical protein
MQRFGLKFGMASSLAMAACTQPIAAPEQRSQSQAIEPDSCDVPSYAAGARYNAGDRVSAGGNIYECKPWPVSGWCSIGGPYAPGTGWAWQEAWLVVGPCTGGDDGDGDDDGSDEDPGDDNSDDGEPGDDDSDDGEPGDDDDEPGDDGLGIHSCQPAFQNACMPNIVFRNEESSGRGRMFNEVIPDPVATMKDVACTVCSILFRSPSEIPQNRRHTTIELILRDNENLADAGGNRIRFDVKHIARYQGNRAAALTEFMGVLVHETTHLYQHYGNGGLGEGMADFVRIRTGFYEPGRRRPGGNWTDPYTTSGFFYSWLAGPSLYHDDARNPHNFDTGYLINKTIGERGPSAIPGLFLDTFGTDVDSLWDEYQSAIR